MIWAICPAAFRGSVLPAADAAGQTEQPAVAWIAGLILFMQLVFMYYQVLPGRSGRQPGADTGWIFSSDRHRRDLAGLLSLAVAALAAACRCTTTTGPAALHLRRIRRRGGAREEALCLWLKNEARCGEPRNRRRGTTRKSAIRTAGSSIRACVRAERHPLSAGIRAGRSSPASSGGLGLSRFWRFYWCRSAPKQDVKQSPYPLGARAVRATARPSRGWSRLDRLAGSGEPSDVAASGWRPRKRLLNSYGPDRGKGIRPHSHQQAIEGGRRQVAGRPSSRREPRRQRQRPDGPGESNSGRMFRGGNRHEQASAKRSLRGKGHRATVARRPAAVWRHAPPPLAAAAQQAARRACKTWASTSGSTSRCPWTCRSPMRPARR